MTTTSSGAPDPAAKPAPTTSTTPQTSQAPQAALGPDMSAKVPTMQSGPLKASAHPANVTRLTTEPAQPRRKAVDSE